MRLFDLRKWMQGRLHGETGQSLVEAALVAPLFFLLLMGAAELARVAYVAIEVSNAARAGVQYGAQGSGTYGDGTGIATAASGDASDANTMSGLTTTSTVGYICSDGTAATLPSTSNNGQASCASGAHALTTVIATASTNFDPLIHLPGLPSTFTIKSRATETCLDCQ